jgi:Fe-S-cluster containining protein
MMRPEFDPTRYRFSCTLCGQCCRWPGDVRLTDKDIARLAVGLQLTEQAVIDRFARLGFRRHALSLRDQADGACVFLGADRCRVYIHRPDQCRRFPFRHTTPDDCPGLVLLEGTE